MHPPDRTLQIHSQHLNGIDIFQKEQEDTGLVGSYSAPYPENNYVILIMD